jgi:hypothetical protein
MPQSLKMILGVVGVAVVITGGLWLLISLADL